MFGCCKGFCSTVIDTKSSSLDSGISFLTQLTHRVALLSLSRLKREIPFNREYFSTVSKVANLSQVSHSSFSTAEIV